MQQLPCGSAPTAAHCTEAGSGPGPFNSIINRHRLDRDKTGKCLGGLRGPGFHPCTLSVPETSQGEHEPTYLLALEVADGKVIEDKEAPFPTFPLKCKIRSQR